MARRVASHDKCLKNKKDVTHDKVKDRCATNIDSNFTTLLWNAFTDSLSLKFKSSKSLFRDRKSVRAFHNNVYLIYLPVCKSAVCICRTPVKDRHKERHTPISIKVASEKNNAWSMFLSPRCIIGIRTRQQQERRLKSEFAFFQSL